MGIKSEAPGTAPSRRPRIIPAEQLFGDSQEIRIVFEGQEYRLRKTRNGKLILTK